MAPPRPETHNQLPRILLWVAIVLVGFGLTWLSIQKASLHDWFSGDLGNMWEAVWRFAHGLGFTFTYRGEVISRLVFHADYLLMLFAPLAWWWREASPLLAVQAFEVAAGAWFVWSIARRVLKSDRLGYAFAAVWLLYGPILFPVIWQFHVVTLAPTLMLAAAEAVIAKRRAWVGWLWFGLACISKEQAGVIVGLFGWLVHWGWGNRKLAWAALGSGTLLTIVNFFLVIPSFRTENSHFVWNYYYGDLGSSTKEQLFKLLNPSVWISRLANAPLAANLIMLLAPLAGLPLLNRWWWIGLLTVMPAWLALAPETKDVFHQNHVLIIPFLFMGAIQGAAQLQRRLQGVRQGKKLVVGGIVSAAVFCNFLFTPYPWSAMWNSNWLLRDPGLDQLIAARNQLPDNARVSFSLGLGRAYRSFPQTELLPYGAAEAEYIAIYAIPEYQNTERTGGQQWRTFNKLAFDYLHTSDLATPMMLVPNGGLFRVTSPAARRQIGADMVELFETAVRPLDTSHEE